MAHGGDGAHEGHDGGHAHAGHATSDALFIAAISTHDVHSAHGSFNCHDHSASDGHSSQALAPHGGDGTGGKTPLVDESGEAIRGFRCHIPRHGKFDTLTSLARLAKKYQLVSPHGYRPGLDSSHSFFPLILDCDAFSHARELSAERPYGKCRECACEKPQGFYPGANGHTDLYSGYWQIGRRKNPFSPLELDDRAGTYLNVSVITWSYFESGDFETRIEVRVISIPEWSQTDQQWGYRKKPFERHQRAALRLCTELMQLLSSTKPSLAAQILRSSIDAKFGSNAEVLEGTEPMTQDEILERDTDLAEDAAHGDQPTQSIQSAASGNATADLVIELDDW